MKMITKNIFSFDMTNQEDLEMLEQIKNNSIFLNKCNKEINLQKQETNFFWIEEIQDVPKDIFYEGLEEVEEVMQDEML